MNSAADLIRDEIRRLGPISFARFMELALYAPEAGYYERQKEIGTRGDFYTSVSVGSLFGELLAFQFADWLNFNSETPASHAHIASPLPDSAISASFASPPPTLQIIEAGAHDGRLALDILTSLQRNHPNVFCRIRYSLLEPSSAHQQWQRKTLSDFGDKISWIESWQQIPDGVTGIIFGNELLDAMPVHRFQWSAKDKAWFELKVDLTQEEFTWAKCPLDASAQSQFDHVRELTAVLPDGFITETSPQAYSWWNDAAKTLQRGKLLTIDYGLTELELFSPERRKGTLRSYSQHRIADDPLSRPGEKDITAHVNFSHLKDVGERAGLQTEALISQTRFLTQIVDKAWKAPEKFGGWNSQKTRQFQTLTHPEHLGRSFRVLIQSR